MSRRREHVGVLSGKCTSLCFRPCKPGPIDVSQHVSRTTVTRWILGLGSLGMAMEQTKQVVFAVFPSVYTDGVF